MSIKKAHRLSPSVLDPKNIEKTSVKLAVAVFCESTRDALQFYATHEGRTAWNGTAQFISLIIKLWNVMNVKGPTKGKHKRDYTMDPVRSSLDWKLAFLREVAGFLKRWQDSKKCGLSKETFLAVRHTCEALADCASHMLDHLGFNYVLLGKLQSDAIESRFGWLRQLSGANYYISTKQVRESDRKIRAVSLLKFSGITLDEIDDAIQYDSPPSASPDDAIADSMAAALSCRQCPTASDANILFYVGGALARSVLHATKCDYCREELISTEPLEPLDIDNTLEYPASTFLDSINRGGLTYPSDYAFLVVVSCWRVFEEIKSSPTLTSQLLQAASHRTLFVKIKDRVTVSQSQNEQLVSDNYCFRGHDLKTLLVQRFFNCVAKNFVKDLSNTANQQSQHASKKRKIDKLTSVSAH